MSSLKKLMSEYGIGALVALLIIAYAVSMFAGYLSDKGSSGAETMTSNAQAQNKQGLAPKGSVPGPSEPLGQNEVFAAVKGVATQAMGGSKKAQDPADLLPKDHNSEWAQLNPSGKGEVGHVNLLKAGYHIGVDTIGQSLRNANLQIRSEPANPQQYVGPWNLSTIEPDFMRPPLEVGQGGQ